MTMITYEEQTCHDCGELFVADFNSERHLDAVAIGGDPDTCYAPCGGCGRRYTIAHRAGGDHEEK